MHDFAAQFAPCGLVELTPDGDIVDANEVFLRWTGRDLDSAVGLKLRDLVEDATSAENAARVASDQTSGPSGTRAVTVKLQNTDGSSLPVLISWNRIEDRFIAALFDATRREEFESQIVSAHSLVERQHRRLNILLASAVAFADALDEAELAKELAAAAEDAYSATTAAVFLIDESAHISLMAGTLPFEQSVQGQELSEQAMLLRSVVSFEDVTASDLLPAETRQGLGAVGVRGMLVAPISHEERQLGLLVVFFNHVRVFDSEAVPLAEALTRQAGQVLARVHLQQRLQRSAMLDDITGLPTRRLFEQQVDRVPSGTDLLGVAFVDLDGFKAVNDTLGHAAGDRILREVASRMQSVVRGNDAVARYGGDEFVAVLAIPDNRAALIVAERLREVLAEPYDLPASLRVSASIGLAVSTREAGPNEAEQLVRLADQAMYRAKRDGGNRVVTA